MASSKITGGVIPALVTPYTARGEVDTDTIRRLVAYHLEKRVDGFYVCGSTGQGLCMSVAERKTAAQAAVQAVGGRVPVIVQIGAVAVRDACDLASDAARIGAAGISSVIPPTYGDLPGIQGYFRAVADAAPVLPLFPYFQGGSHQPLAVMRELSGLASLQGTKYTGPNMFELAAIAGMTRSPWTVFAGMDEQCVFAAMSGAHGNIGSSVNVMPGVYRGIWQAVAAGAHGEAMDLQRKANRIISILAGYGYGGALREALGILGFPCGTMRLPDRPLDPNRKDDLRRDLEEAGFGKLAAL